MMRNDYHRALILLRGNAPGFSGHVRLERRTLTGSMYFLLQAPAGCETLRVALAGQHREDYFACALGETRRDARGQAVLSYSFDPRNICGHTLEEYQLIVVSCADAQDCEIVLHGNVNGHAALSWEKVREATCALYAPAETAEDQSPPIPENGAQTMPEDADTAQTAEEAPQDAEAAQPKETPSTAGELLQIDMEKPWHESVEAMRPLFRLSAPMENPPDGEYIYIAAAMPPESGYSYCAVGVRTENGAPVSLRYALPALWTAEPPVGLEEYAWVGDLNHGWWMTQVDLPNSH